MKIDDTIEKDAYLVYTKLVAGLFPEQELDDGAPPRNRYERRHPKKKIGIY